MTSRAFASLAALTMLMSVVAVLPAADAAPSFATINPLTPTSGSTNGGTVLTISGSGFLPGAVVQFADSAGGIHTATSVEVTTKDTGETYKELKATTPAHPTPGKVTVIVTNPNSESASSAEGFTYVAAPAPTLSSVFPTAGTANGNDVVVLSGTGFSTGVAPRVVFGGTVASGTITGGVPATVLQPLSATRLAVLVPGRGGLPPGGNTFGIAVQNPDNSAPAALSAGNGFTYVAQQSPSLSSVSPISGSSNGGTVLTLTGSGFSPGAQVQFLSHDTGDSGEAPAVSVVYISSSQLNVVTPSITDATCDASPCSLPVTSGGIDIRVTNPDGTTAVLEPAFSFSNAAAPTVTSLSLARGPSIGGTTITITGSGFAAGPHLAVQFGTEFASRVTFVSSSQLTAVTPACVLPACGTSFAEVVVKVVNPDGKGSTQQVKYNYTSLVRIGHVKAGPTGVPLSSVGVGTNGRPVGAPDESPSNLVFLEGAGFPSPCRVLVGTQEATSVTCTGGTTASFAAPPSLPGVKDITLLGGDGTDGRGAVMRGAITYSLSPQPSVTSITPATGGSNSASGSGPTTVTIAGANFIRVQDASGAFTSPQVVFGASGSTLNGKVTAASAGSLTVEVPAIPSTQVPAAPGGLDVTVRVTNLDGQSLATPLPTFRYTRDPPPQLSVSTTCSPLSTPCPSGPTTGGTQFTLVGSGFVVGTKVTFGGLGSVTAVACPATPTETCVNPAGTSLTVFSPPSTSGTAQTVGLTLANPDGQTFTPPTTNPYSFSYTATQPPQVVSVLPATLPANGGPVAIGNTRTPLVYGPRLSATIGTTVILACNATVPNTPYCIKPTDVSGNTLNVMAPGRATSGAVAVSITNADGQSDSLADALAYSPSSALSAAASPVSPTNGALGTVVTVTGGGFAENARLPTVRMGTTCTTGTLSPTCVQAVVCTGENLPTAGCKAPVSGTVDKLSFKVPAHASPGPQTIILTNPDGNSISIGGALRTLALPTGVGVASPARDTVNGGAKVTFTGTGFDPSAPPLLALFGDPPRLGSGFETTSATQATAIAPLSASTGQKPVYLVDRDGQSLTLRNVFEYTQALPPTFASISPPLVSVNGGAQVTVTGTGFAPGVEVCLRTLGLTTVSATGIVSPACTEGSAGRITTPVTVSLPSATGITTLSFLAPSRAAGPVDVVISNPSGAATDTLLLPGKESRLGYTQVPGPVLSSIAPNTGNVAGGTAITLTGLNFASGASVAINGSAATDVVVVSPTSITAKTPAGKAGTATVTVTVSGLSTSLINGFTYTGTTTTTTTGTTTTTTTGTTTTTTTSTTTGPKPAAPTTEQIIAANKAVVVTVTRDGEDNVVTFVLPSNLPGTPAGVQIFRSTSPYTLVTTLVAGSPAYAARSYRDIDQPLDATYKVTVFYANNLGKANADPAAEIPGFDQVGGVQSDAVKQDFYTKLAYGIGIGILVILVAVLVVVLVRRQRRPAAPYPGGDVGYVAPPAEEQPSTEPAAPAAPAGPTHTVNCPICKSTFEAVGEKPLRMRCPHCGREGILR